MVKIVGGGQVLCAIIAVFIVSTQGRDPNLEALENEAQLFMSQLNQEVEVKANKAAIALWNYETNITQENKDARMSASLELTKWNKKIIVEVNKYPWREFQNSTLRRMFEKYSGLGTNALPEDKKEQLLQTISDMETNFATAKVCSYKEPTKCDLELEPDITEIFSKSQDPEELKYYWLEWHRVAGSVVRDNFTQYVELENEAAKLNNFSSLAEMWQSQYEVDDLEEQMANMWEEIKPLYLQMHAYVRKRLRDKYGDKIVSAKGPSSSIRHQRVRDFTKYMFFPGNMWAQEWENINSFTLPYPDKQEEDITVAMIKQNYTPQKIFHMADEFFQSLNLTAMPELFWKNSIIEKPTDRKMSCQAGSLDLRDGKDFRIKQCTSVNYDHFKICHHEMGHIEYFLQYRDLPDVFRQGANPAFHEAVGDTIALSVSSPKHLRRVGLSSGTADDEQTKINQLFQMGMDKIVFLPFGYLLDLYRYGIFRGTTTPQDYNCHFWRLRESLQGVEPPAPRTEKDFDAAAKHHVSSDTEYVRYYIGYIIQFQFHRTLCQLAGEFVAGDPKKRLVDCDIYQSATAGNAFANMMKLGSSKPWPDAMEALTGQRQMKADGVLEYFKPLHDWLIAENQRTGEFIGWESSKIEYCTPEQTAALDNNKPQKRILKLRRS